MAIELKKKKPIELAKEQAGPRVMVAGLGWDTSEVNGKAIDCDVSVFMLGSDNKIPAEEYFVFYNNLVSADGAVKHRGDNRDGAGDGDDESIEIDLSKIDVAVMQLLFIVTIHESEERGHHFGHVRQASIRIYDQAKQGEELCFFNLTEQFDGQDSVLIARIYRHEDGWQVEAMGDAFGGGLATLVDLYT